MLMHNVLGECIVEDVEQASEANVMDLIQEALNLYNMGEYTDSLNIYNSIIEIEEENVNALYSIGVIKAHQQEIDDAIKFFEKVNHIMPNHPPTVANLSYLLEEREPVEAAEYAKIALITYPEMSELKRISEIEISDLETKIINESVEEEPLLISKPVIDEIEEDVLDTLVSSELTAEEKARELNNMGDYIAAVKSWKEILEIKPKSYEAWYGLSEALKMAGHHEKSIQCKNRGDILKEEKSGMNEIEIFEENNEEFSENQLNDEEINQNSVYNENVNVSIEWYNKGINFLSEEKSSDALSCFEKAIGGCPREEKELRVRSQNGRGDALYQMAKYSESILAYHAAISLEPSLLTGRTLYNMGQSYAFLELYEDALKCFEQSISRGLEKDGIETCKTQINRCKILLREQNKRKNN
ncbi:MAG: hypothetical protein CMA58_03160 [Euryarchaeota archaeon]|nr:hypothetical protein [Euryarchaeota archaeon]